MTSFVADDHPIWTHQWESLGQDCLDLLDEAGVQYTSVRLLHRQVSPSGCTPIPSAVTMLVSANKGYDVSTHDEIWMLAINRLLDLLASHKVALGIEIMDQRAEPIGLRFPPSHMDEPTFLRWNVLKGGIEMAMNNAGDHWTSVWLLARNQHSPPLIVISLDPSVNAARREALFSHAHWLVGIVGLPFFC